MRKSKSPIRSLYLTVGVLPGSDISRVSREAVYLADFLGMDVVFVFNDVTCWVKMGDRPEDILSQWRQKMEKREAPK